MDTNYQNSSIPVDELAEYILTKYQDSSIIVEARGIAFYMLFCEKLTLDYCKKLFDTPNSNYFVKKLIDSASTFFDPIPQSLGIHIGSNLIADSTQDSLDVKRSKLFNNNNKDKIEHGDSGIIQPQIKLDLLYSHKTKYWIRFFLDDLEKLNFLYEEIYIITNDIYEIYYTKNAKFESNIFQVIGNLDVIGANVIFCSELKLFQYSPLLFLSNFVKFMYCYKSNKCGFDPQNAQELEDLNKYFIYAMSFLDTCNLNITTPKTHGPLITYSGERPKPAFRKFNSKLSYINEGTRAMLSVDRPSDLGIQSNFIEICSELDLLDSKLLLSNIV